MTRCIIACVVGFSLLTSTLRAEPAPAGAKVYNENADAKADIKAALAKASANNQRVLMEIGGNWCGWCIKLHDLFVNDKTIATKLRDEYQVIYLDIGRGDKNQDIIQKYGIRPQGYPYLAVLSPDDKLVTQQETSSLEVGPKHDPTKVGDFLDKWKATPLDATKELESALARAKAENKRVFLRFGAPWCGWCHKLDDVLLQPAVYEALETELVVLKIDTDRMTVGKDVQKKYQSGGGIPWFAILSPDGKVISTSELPGAGNVGFPTEPNEIAHVVQIFSDARTRMSDQQVETIRKALTDAADKVNAARKAKAG